MFTKLKRSDQNSPDATNSNSTDAETREKFNPFRVPEESKNLVLVHSYRVSNTEEKFKVPNRCQKQKLKCVNVQDGTNSVLKNKYITPDKILIHQ